MYLYLERWEGSEKEREQNTHLKEKHRLAASGTCPDQELNLHSGTCPDQESNW